MKSQLLNGRNWKLSRYLKEKAEEYLYLWDYHTTIKKHLLRWTRYKKYIKIID